MFNRKQLSNSSESSKSAFTSVDLLNQSIDDSHNASHKPGALSTSTTISMCDDDIIEINENETSLQPDKSTPLKRPDSLILNCSNNDNMPAATLHSLDDPKNKIVATKEVKQKYLYRSNSSRTYRKSYKSKLNLENEFDNIYFISSNKNDDFYDSIDVIDERRMKNFKKTDSGGFFRSSSSIYSEYCSLDQKDAAEHNITPANKNYTAECKTTTLQKNSKAAPQSSFSDFNLGNDSEQTIREMANNQAQPSTTTITVKADIEECSMHHQDNVDPNDDG